MKALDGAYVEKVAQYSAPDWHTWLPLTKLSILDALCLSMNICPVEAREEYGIRDAMRGDDEEGYGPKIADTRARATFQERLRMLHHEFGREVKPGKLANFARKADWSIPAELAALTYRVPDDGVKEDDSFEVEILAELLDELEAPVELLDELEAPAELLVELEVPAELLDEAEYGIKKSEKKIRAIIEMANSVGFDPLNIPRSGKKILLFNCKASRPDLFGKGDHPFLDAWKIAVREDTPRLRTAGHAMYSKRVG